jgi:hypothetical protein
MLRVIMLNVIIMNVGLAECHDPKSHYDECHDAGSHYAECFMLSVLC